MRDIVHSSRADDGQQFLLVKRALETNTHPPRLQGLVSLSASTLPWRLSEIIGRFTKAPGIANRLGEGKNPSIRGHLDVGDNQGPRLFPSAECQASIPSTAAITFVSGRFENVLLQGAEP